MGRVTPKKFSVEDFPDQETWIGPLFSGLNQLVQDIVSSFGNQLTVKENLYQEIKEIKWLNQAQDFPLKFRTKFVANPRGLSVIYLQNNSTGSASTLAPWLVWSYADGQLTISAITGLTAGVSYTMRVLVIYE